MTNTLRSFILVSFAFTCAACSGGEDRAKAPLPISSLVEYRRCERDEQCTWVNNGCCDCANDGEDIAVAVDKKEAFRARFDCSDTPCTAMDIDPPCGTGKAACEAGLCVFLETN